jgi:hypothetical protein
MHKSLPLILTVARVAAFALVLAACGPPPGLDVTNTANPEDPLVVNIAGGQGTLSVGSSLVLSASVSNYTGNVVYAWYVNGLVQGTGPSFTFGPGLGAGYYRIDVTAFTDDGTRAGSATLNVLLTPSSLSVARTNSGAISAFGIGSDLALINHCVAYT